MDDYVLVLNAGSSSLKFCVYRAAGGRDLAAGGARPDRRHRHLAALSAKDEHGHMLADEQLTMRRARRRAARSTSLAPGCAPATAARACSASAIASSTAGATLHRPDDRHAAGARGAAGADPARAAASAAQPGGDRGGRRAAPGRAAGRLLRHELSSRPAGGRRARAAAAEIRETGVQRYGFHGLSYEYIASVLPEVAPEIATGRVIVAHLGSGASLCAHEGRQERRQHARASRRSTGCAWARGRAPSIPASSSICSRPRALGQGSRDHALQEVRPARHFRHQQRHARSARKHRPGARLAVDYFVYRAAKEIGALAAVLGGIDALVFTAGIGENSAEIRRRICEASAWLGIELDAEANARNGPRISTRGSKVSAWVIPTNEELMIARHTGSLLGLGKLRVASQRIGNRGE